MKTLVVYDSQFGNTEQIARAIAGGLGSAEQVRVSKASETTSADVVATDLLVVGAPTQGGRATLPIQQFLGRLPDGLGNTRVAAFDTRMKMWIVKVFGFAANRIEQDLKAHGGILIAAPEGFFVKASKGPLLDGELERATQWGRDLVTRADVQ
jgi:flavodoxin I